MNQNLEQEIDNRINAGFEVDLGKMFENVMPIWKKVVMYIAIALFLMVSVMAVMALITFPIFLGVGFTGMIETLKRDPTYFSSAGVGLGMRLYTFAFGAVGAFLLTPLTVGFLKLCRDADTTGEVEFGSLFAYYKQPYFLNIGLAAVILSAISNVISMGFGYIPFFGGILNLVVTFVIQAFIIFVYPLIVFKDASSMQGIALSFKLASKKLMPIFGAVLLFSIIGVLGVILCGIGILFTYPFIPIAQYLIYKQAIGFDDDQENTLEDTSWQENPPVTE